MRWPWSPREEASPPSTPAARAGGTKKSGDDERVVCCFLDDSPGAERAWKWAAGQLLNPKRDRCAVAHAQRCAARRATLLR